jgi:S1-C subfamily serine protease
MRLPVLRVLLVLLLAVPLGAAAQTASPDQLRTAVAAVVRLTAEIPADARSARTLGTRRDGNGVVIDSQGLVLTIGYLINEAMAVTVFNAEGKPVPAQTVAYDFDTGFGLVRALAPLGIRPVPLGASGGLKEGAAVLAVGAVGPANAASAKVVSRRTFAGGWEYLVQGAIYTAPPIENWGGAALIGPDARLYGIGSLFVGDAEMPGERMPGNMFVPIDLLKPVFADLLADGRSANTPRPWIGASAAEMGGRLVITQVQPGSPGERAGLAVGDVISSVAGKRVGSLAEYYETLWRDREAGATVELRVRRDGASITVPVKTASRYDYIKPAKSY